MPSVEEKNLFNRFFGDLKNEKTDVNYIITFTGNDWLIAQVALAR